MTIRIIVLSFLRVAFLHCDGKRPTRPVHAADAGVSQPDAGPAHDAGPDRKGRSGRGQALKEQLMQLPPAQRKAKIEELKQQVTAEKAQKLQQRKDEFQGKWDKATPEQRAKFCTNVKQKCADGGKKFACEIAPE